MNIRNTLVIILICNFFITYGQPKFKTFSPKKMQKDLKVLQESLTAHPDPYTKITESEFQKIIHEQEVKFEEELDEIEFYKSLSTIVAAIKDGHSGISMPKEWLTKLRKKHGGFPYKMHLTNDGQLYVIKSFGNGNIPVGAEITAINGMNVSDFIDQVDPYISYEIIPFRNNTISNDFEFLLYLIFKKTDGLTFSYKSIQEEEEILNNIPYKEWKSIQKDDAKIREQKIAKGKPYDYEIITPGIAKIDIFSFAIRDLKKYNIFLLETFKSIKENDIHSLIIDVRGNYGGWPKIASELFHYIHQGHYKTMAMSNMKISHPYRRFYTDNFPLLRSNNFSFKQRRHFVDIDQVLYGKIGSYVIEDAFFNESSRTENYEYYGDTYLLTDRRSYSAASSFAATFQCYNMGYIIGEPTGGTKIFRANPMFKELPKSQFLLRLSTTKLFTTCYDQEDQPVIPNIEISPSILDIIHDVDSQLNTTIRIIRKIQKENAENEKAKSE